MQGKSLLVVSVSREVGGVDAGDLVKTVAPGASAAAGGAAPSLGRGGGGDPAKLAAALAVRSARPSGHALPSAEVRILGVDYGTGRTGVALSDPLGSSVAPLEIIGEREKRRLMTAILEVVAAADGATEIVVGLPRPLLGRNQRATAACRVVSGCACGVGHHHPVQGWDERFTSKMATSRRACLGPRDGGVGEDGNR